MKRTLLFSFIFPIILGSCTLGFLKNDQVKLAQEHWIKNDRAQAVSILKSEVNEHNNNTARWQLAEYYLLLEEVSSAQKEFDAILKNTSDKTETRKKIASMYVTVIDQALNKGNTIYAAKLTKELTGYKNVLNNEVKAQQYLEMGKRTPEVKDTVAIERIKMIEKAETCFTLAMLHGTSTEDLIQSYKDLGNKGRSMDMVNIYKRAKEILGPACNEPLGKALITRYKTEKSDGWRLMKAAKEFISQETIDSMFTWKLKKTMEFSCEGLNKKTKTAQGVTDIGPGERVTILATSKNFLVYSSKGWEEPTKTKNGYQYQMTIKTPRSGCYVLVKGTENLKITIKIEKLI